MKCLCQTMNFELNVEPKCRAGCPKIYDPQCGTDGKTYGNPCLLKYAQCKSDGKIRLAHHGECGT